jgi:hypothetical protein
MRIEVDPIHRGRRLEMIRLILALRQSDSVKGFWIHFIAFAVVMPVLLVINLVGSPSPWWVQWPFLGWGIGLIVHAIAVFGLGGWLGPAWEEKRINDYIERHDRGA